jgi:HlyD family secretion protein
MDDRMDSAITGDAATSRKRKWLIGLSSTAVLAIAFVTFWPSPHASIAPIPVQSGPLADSVPINAVLTPSHIGAVATLSGGTVSAIIAFGGQRVKAGDTLLKLGNTDLERQLSEARSELAGARSDLASQQADAQDQADSLGMEKLKAANALRIADMQLEAERKLQQQGIISLLALKRTEAERDGKQMELDYSSHHFVQAHAASRAKAAAAAERVAVLQSKVAGLQASVDALTLKAPFDGVVAKIDGKPGASVAPGTQLAEVITSDLQIELEVAEQYADALHPGQRLQLQGGLTGKVLSLSPAADGGVVKGRAEIDGDTRKLRSNTTLPGEAILAEHGTGLFVQIEGVDIENRSLTATIQAPDGKTESRQIQFGPRYRQKVVVLNGAVSGEFIVGLDTGESK